MPRLTLATALTTWQFAPFVSGGGRARAGVPDRGGDGRTPVVRDRGGRRGRPSRPGRQGQPADLAAYNAYLASLGR